MSFNIQRNTLIKTHIVLAAFFLPVLTMYFISGALYTWGIKGGYNTDTHTLSLAQPLEKDRKLIHDLVVKNLLEKNLPLPTGQGKIKNAGTSYKFEWTGSNLDIELEPTSDPLFAKMKVKETSWYRQFVQLHKAKGGVIFKYYAVILAISLLLLLMSGLFMAWQLTKYRPVLIGSFMTGILSFIAMVVLS
jgi:hypothetical protein